MTVLCTKWWWVSAGIPSTRTRNDLWKCTYWMNSRVIFMMRRWQSLWWSIFDLNATSIQWVSQWWDQFPPCWISTSDCVWWCALDELIEAIHQDIEDAKTLLDLPDYMAFSKDEIFSKAHWLLLWGILSSRKLFVFGVFTCVCVSVLPVYLLLPKYIFVCVLRIRSFLFLIDLRWWFCLFVACRFWFSIYCH